MAIIFNDSEPTECAIVASFDSFYVIDDSAQITSGAGRLVVLGFARKDHLGTAI